MSEMTFADLGLSQPVLRALDDCGYSQPTPIQEAAIPIVIAGHDLIGCAQTGTGKTAAFMLPIIDELATSPQHKGDMPLALVLTPTRELALQIEDNVRAYGKYAGTRSCVVLGGVSAEPQISRLRRGVDVVIGTPGRLIDLIQRGELILEDVDFLVLDEADRMLDMGFVHDVRWIADQVPTPRQTLLFSATISPAIKSLASTMQTDAQSVSVTPPATIADNIDQQILFVEKANKRAALVELLQREETERALVFTGTKSAATVVARQLEQSGIRAGGPPERGQRSAARAGGLHARQGERARGDGHRRPRHRRRRHLARDQLRPARGRRELCAPHRTHGAGRAGRSRRFALRDRGCFVVARGPAAGQGADARARRSHLALVHRGGLPGELDPRGAVEGVEAPAVISPIRGSDRAGRRPPRAARSRRCCTRTDWEKYPPPSSSRHGRTRNHACNTDSRSAWGRAVHPAR